MQCFRCVLTGIEDMLSKSCHLNAVHLLKELILLISQVVISHDFLQESLDFFSPCLSPELEFAHTDFIIPDMILSF